MLHQGIRIQLACFAQMLSATCAQSGKTGSANLPHYANFYDNIEISASGGPNWFNTKDTELVISPFETDSTQIGRISNNGTWKVGIGYYLFDEQLASRFFKSSFV